MTVEDIMFYIDLTKYMNEPNLRLQGENQLPPDLLDEINSFRQKIVLFQLQFHKIYFYIFQKEWSIDVKFTVDFTTDVFECLEDPFWCWFSNFNIVDRVLIFENTFDPDTESPANHKSLLVISRSKIGYQLQTVV